MGIGQCFGFWIKPANSYNGSEDEKLWSENESRKNATNHPMPTGQISPKGPLKGPGKGGCPLCQVADVEVCKWEEVDEGCQHPGQELEGR